MRGLVRRKHSTQKPNVTHGEVVVSLTGHVFEKVVEASFVHIVVANDRAPGRSQFIHSLTNGFILRNSSLVRYVTGYKREGDPVCQGRVNLFDNAPQVSVVLLAGCLHVNVTDMHP